MDSIKNNVTGNIENIAGIKTPSQKSPQKQKPTQEVLPGDKFISGDMGKNDGNILSPGKILEMKSGIQSVEKASELSSVTQTAYVNAHVDGWVGNNFANLNVSQSGDNIDTDGWVGSGTAHINEWKHSSGSSISGSVHDPGGEYKNVNLNSYGQEGNRNISGWIGRDSVHLYESSMGTDYTRISGSIGGRYMNISCQNRNGSIHIDGYINDNNTGHSERIWVSGNQNPQEPEMSYLGILPALTITDDSKKANIAG